MTTRYIDYETVVDINADHGGPGAGVRDEAGIRSALGRASATFMGRDLVPSLSAKAAVILHGLSSTQYFHDGNKRTAWLAANLFLELNDAPLKKMPTVAAEAFVLSIATKAFEVDEHGSDRAVEKAAEWITQSRFRMRDRLDYAVMAVQARVDADTDTFDAEQAQLASVGLSAFPQLVELTAIVRINFTLEDAYRDWALRVTIDAPTGAARIVKPNAETLRHIAENGVVPDGFDIVHDVVDYDESVALAFEDLSGRHATGVVPSLTVMPLPILCNYAGSADFVFTVNGQFLARRAFDVREIPNEGWTITALTLPPILS